MSMTLYKHEDASENKLQLQEIRELFKISEGVAEFIALHDKYRHMKKAAQELDFQGLKSVQEMLFFHSKNWKKLVGNLEKVLKTYPSKHFYFPKPVFKNINTKNMVYHLSYMACEAKAL